MTIIPILHNNDVRFIKYLLAFLLIMKLSACNGGEETSHVNGKGIVGSGRGSLVSSTLIESMGSNEIQIEIDAIQGFNVTSYYDVDVYKIVYETVDV